MLGMRSGTSKSPFALRSATVILAAVALRPPWASAQGAFAHGSLKWLYGVSDARFAPPPPLRDFAPARFRRRNRAYAYRGLRALASLSMARSEGT